MDHFLGVARNEGITEKELGAVLAIVMAVSGGRVRAQYRELRSKSETKP
jgi:alkylhydroperoxidase/carboxymuconolactone decarboxylase family protein YurZ